MTWLSSPSFAGKRTTDVTLVREADRIASAVLPSGLTLLVETVPHSGVAATCLHVNVGFRNERLTGSAHLIEHILTEGRTAGDSDDDIIAGIGGSINAHTSLDYTQFTTVAPISGLASMLRIQIARLDGHRYDAAIVKAQQAVVEAEIQRNILRRPHGDLVLIALPALLYDDYPNSHNGYASIEEIGNLEPDEVLELLGPQYNPRAATLAVAGPMNPDEVLDLIAYNSSVQDSPMLPASVSPTQTTHLAPLTESREATVGNGWARTARTAWGFRLDGPTDTDQYVAAVLASELLEELGQRCNCDHTACGRGPLASRVNRTGNPFDVAHDSMLVIEAGHRHGASPARVRECMTTSLQHIVHRHDFTDRLRQVAEAVALDLLATTESLVSRASWMCIDSVLFGDPHRFTSVPDRLREVPADSVRLILDSLSSSAFAQITSVPEAV